MDRVSKKLELKPVTLWQSGATGKRFPPTSTQSLLLVSCRSVLFDKSSEVKVFPVFVVSTSNFKYCFIMTNDTEEKAPTIADDLVVTKYKMAAEIVNRKFEKFRALNKHEFPVAMRWPEYVDEVIWLTFKLKC